MKIAKKVLAVALAAAISLTLCASAFATGFPQSVEEMEKYSTFETDKGINTYIDIVNLDLWGNPITAENYYLSTDSVSTISNNTNAGGDDFIEVMVGYFAKTSDGTYTMDYAPIYLKANGDVVTEDIPESAEAETYAAKLMPGESMTVTGQQLVDGFKKWINEDGNISDYVIYVEATHYFTTGEDYYDCYSLTKAFTLNNAKVQELRAAANKTQTTATTTTPTTAGNDLGFTDVKTTDYFYNAVKWAKDNKITSGTGDGTTFSPDAELTVAQMLQLLYAHAGSPAVTTSGKEWYSNAQAWAIEKGYIKASEDVLAKCNGLKVVEMMYAAEGSPAVSGTSPFSDADGNAVIWAANNGVTKGDGNGHFLPDTILTRARAVQFLYNAFAK